MKSVCRRTRITDPAGVWNYKNMIGATARIKSMSVSNLNNIFAFDSTTLHVIEDIYFRVTTDGKVVTIIRLEDMPDCLFTWKDLEILNMKYISKAVCGQCLCDQARCGGKGSDI